MSIAFVSLALLLGLVQGEQPGVVVPTVAPFFMSRGVEGGPAFMVECRNTTDHEISSGAVEWTLARSAIRIDGEPLSDQAQMGPGLMSDIPPGGTWRGIVELRQVEPRHSYAVALGANVRMPTVVPLAAGRHTIAVRCLDVWSADVAFYWEK